MTATRAAARGRGSAEPRVYGRWERLALIAGALIMLAIVVVSVLVARVTELDLSQAARAEAAQVLTAEVLQGVISAETGQRGYLLTQRPAYRAPYDAASARVPGLLDRLDGFLAGDPSLPRWRSLIQSKMAELRETVELESAGRHAEALAMVMTDRGHTTMVAIRAIADGLSATQGQIASAKLRRSQQGTRLLVAVDTIALIQLLILSAFVSRSLRTTVHALRRSAAALQQANTELQEGRDSLEIAVRDRTAELTLANEEIQRFAYIVSHDLRAPLLNIIGFTSELETATATLNTFVHAQASAGGTAVPADVRAASEEDLPEAIRFIQTSTAKMDRLINAILRLSREGRRVLAPERLDMSALLRASVDTVRHQAAAADAEIVVGEIPAIVSDRIAVDQVFSNLVDNALKYLADGRPGRIEVQGRKQGGMAVVTVRDNGRGIAARDLDRIFELFRRAGVQNRPGEGIGLAHVKALVRRLGGTIECESTLGEGSVFTVRLPLVLSHGGAELTQSGA